MQRKGIILSGGSGTRLYPITMSVSKQLLPLYDKPMIYYPLTILMLAGIREIAIVTTPSDQKQFKQLLGNGSQWGVTIEWITQYSPDGLAQAYLLTEEFLSGAPSAMVLGDNMFFGHDMQHLVKKASEQSYGATVFGHRVVDPHRYGVVEFDAGGNVISIEEKPEFPKSNFAVTGLYFMDSGASERARSVSKSKRGELEITSLLDSYLRDGALNVEKLGRGYAWFDTGTHDSLLEAGEFVRTIEKRQGQKIGCPEEVAHYMGWVTSDELGELAAPFLKTEYGQYLLRLVE